MNSPMEEGVPEPAPKRGEEDKKDEEGFDEGEEGRTMKAIKRPGRANRT